MRPVGRVTDKKVEAAVMQLVHHGAEITAAHDEAHIRPAITESGERRRQPRGDEIARRADTNYQVRARSSAADMHDLIVEREQPARVAHYQFALRRQFEIAGGAVEQFAAKEHLQALDLRAHRRLGDAE